MKLKVETIKGNKILGTTKEELILVTLKDETAKKNVKEKRKPLNVCFVIDNSGSMGDRVKTQAYTDYYEKLMKQNLEKAEFYQKHPRRSVPSPLSPFRPVWPQDIFLQNCTDPYVYFEKEPLPEHLKVVIPMPPLVTKMTQAKDAAKEAIKSLGDEDIVSIVKFSGSATVVLNPINVTKENLVFIENAIDSISPEGATNLYDGWYHGASLVAKNIDNQKINRIITLTDGQATMGIRDCETFSEKVDVMLNAGISSSTIGVGDTFNEVLLETIAIAGNGNFYYVNEETNLNDVFMKEFNDIKNTAAQGVELSFDLASGIVVHNMTKDVLKEKTVGVYSIPNIRIQSQRSVLFKLEISSKFKKTKELVHLLKAKVKYINNEGKVEHVESSFDVSIVNKKEYEASEDVQEIKVQKALIEVAENQRKALEEMQKGNIALAKNMIGETLFAAQNSGVCDQRLSTVSASLSASLNNIDSVDKRESLRKEMYHSSYTAFRGE